MTREEAVTRTLKQIAGMRDELRANAVRALEGYRVTMEPDAAGAVADTIAAYARSLVAPFLTAQPTTLAELPGGAQQTAALASPPEGETDQQLYSFIMDSLVTMDETDTYTDRSNIANAIVAEALRLRSQPATGEGEARGFMVLTQDDVGGQCTHYLFGSEDGARWCYERKRQEHRFAWLVRIVAEAISPPAPTQREEREAAAFQAGFQRGLAEGAPGVPTPEAQREEAATVDKTALRAALDGEIRSRRAQSMGDV